MSRELRVITPGLFTTVQDLGRPGRSVHGVPAGGAADTVSLRLGNRMVGNPESAAALEITLAGGEFAFDELPEMAVVVGGDVEIGAVGDEAGVLKIGRVTRGARAYLCIAGGVVVPPVMGSASTLASAGLGGLGGRPLRAGDRLAIGEARGTRTELGAGLIERILERRVIRAVEGAQAAAFGEGARRAFWKSEFVVTPQSDRAGLRLSGPAVESPGGGRMVSEGMMWGAVQVPENGAPIVLMCDGPTTGGYPVIACVIAADLPVLGQLPPLAKIRFERVTIDEARRIDAEQEAELRRG